MTALPGRCRSCERATTVEGLVDFGFASEVRLSGMSFANACPRCGGDVEIVEGTFDFVGEILEIVTAPYWTYDTLLDLRGELQWALQHLADDPDVAVEQIEKVSPEVGSLIRRTMTHELYQPTLALIGVLISVLSLVLAGMAYGQSAQQNPTLDQRVKEEIDRAFNQPPGSDHANGHWDRDSQSGDGDDVDRHGDTPDK